MSAMQGALSAAERSMRSVFVGNIPYEATEEQLKDIFAEVGPVVSFRLVYDRETGKPKGYGFCEYKDQEMALSAMRNLNSYELNGRALRVDNAASEKSKEELKNLQASLGGPPVESPFGPEVPPEKAHDAVSRIMCSLPPEQLYDLILQMKQCIESNPNEARNLLVQNPQLSYALLQSHVIMKVIDLETAKKFLHTPGVYYPTGPGALLPTPEKKNPVPNPPAMNEPTPAYSGAVPAAPMNTMQPNPGIPSVRPPHIQPGMQSRPALLGERPPMVPDRPPMMSDRGAPNTVLQPPFSDRDPRSHGDHDLRQMPMADRDMRANPMMMADKDMRQVDQDLRTLPGMPDSRAFDPRYRNTQVPMDGPGFNRPGPPGFDGRAGPGMMPGPRPPVAPVASGPPIRGPPQNPRVGAVGGVSPAIGNASPNPTASPRSSLAAAAAAIAPHDQEKAALIMQVLQLSDQQIALLPPEQRQSIMILKEQISRNQLM